MFWACLLHSNRWLMQRETSAVLFWGLAGFQFLLPNNIECRLPLQVGLKASKFQENSAEHCQPLTLPGAKEASALVLEKGAEWWTRAPTADDVHINIMSLTKYMKALNAENYKMLLKEIKEDLNKWESISWI